MRFTIYPSPAREEYLYQQQVDETTGLNYTRRVYASKNTAVSGAYIGGVLENLLLESGDILLLESGDKLQLQSSSYLALSLIYLLSANDPEIIGSAGLGRLSGSADEEQSLVFAGNFFKPGDVLVYIVKGEITEHAANTSLQFSITFPDGGTAATVNMPTTVTQDALSDWELSVTSTFGYSGGNGSVTHTGRLQVTNSDETLGQSTSALTVVTNTFNYEDVLYYKPQVSWNAQNASTTSNFNSAHMLVN